jgi:hypothetical protein
MLVNDLKKDLYKKCYNKFGQLQCAQNFRPDNNMNLIEKF